MRSNLVLVCILAVVYRAGAAQDTLTRDNVESWQPVWRFAQGDDPAWASPDLDDADWNTTGETIHDPGIVDTVNWKGIGWFRSEFVADSSIAGVPLGYDIVISGAAEMYLDGLLIEAWGRPSRSLSAEHAVRYSKHNRATGLLPVLDAGTHHLALRISNFRLAREGETEFGFKLSFAEPTRIASRAADRSYSLAAKTYLLTGIAAVLAFIYLLLFIFQPKQTNNLYFGILSGLVAFVVFADLHSRIVEDVSAYLDWRRYMELSAIAGWIVAVRLIRVSFFKEPWRLFYPLLAIAGLVAIHVYFDPIGGFWTLTIFSLLATAELLRRVGLAVFLSRPGSTIVAVGAALFMIGALHDYISDLGWIDPVLGVTDLTHVGMVSFTVLFALFLGTDFARVNRSLQDRIQQINREAEKAIQEEKVNQGLRIERIQAEFDNRRRDLEQNKAREVDEIRKSLTVAKEHLKEMQDRLVRVDASASLGKLVTGIAHDTDDQLKNVLRLCSLSTDLVDELQGSVSSGLKPGQAEDLLRPLRKNLDRIEEQSAAVRSMMEDVLRHSSSASEGYEQVEINRLIDRYLNLTLHGARGEHPDLDLVVERVFDSKTGTVRARSVRLGQALMGIFRNAIESVAAYTEKAGEDFQPTITVSTQRLDHAVLIRVRDNGPGVPQELRDKVFEPFFSTTGDKAGLGLSIAHQAIVDELDGTFGLEHFKEQGAGFYITIPFSADSAEKEHDGDSE